MRLGSVALSLLVALVVSALATAGTTASRQSASDPALAKFYGQKLVWKACGAGFDCTKALVPLDYAKPKGPTIKLALKRVKGTAAKRVGTLFFDPGGPGGSGVELVAQIGPSLSTNLQGRYDIVGLDPRGVGASNPLECISDARLDAWFAKPAAPATAAAKKAYIRAITQFGKSCLRTSGALAAHVSTVEVAKDLDVLRALVGDRKLSYLGWSYGTKIGSVYAELFPTLVGRMVLDGPEHPRFEGVEAERSQLRGYEIALRAFVRDCVARADCPLGTSDAAMQNLASFVQGLAGKPIPTSEPQRPLTDSRAVVGIIGRLYTPSTGWPLLRAALTAGLQGDGTFLAGLADQYIGRQESGYSKNGNEFEANQAVVCLDSASRKGASVAEKALPEFRTISPVLGPMFAWNAAVCELWPIKAANPRPAINPVGAPPVLVVGTTRDNATPYSQAVALAKALPKSVLLTYDGDGHLAYLTRGSKCIDTAVNRYFLTGKLPPKGTRCTS
jgi:pimeloyl-ACP methyl ester carboxylesterase